MTENSFQPQARVLVLMVSNANIVGACFDKCQLSERIFLDIRKFWTEKLELFLRDGGDISYAFLGSVNHRLDHKITEILRRYQIPFSFVEEHQFLLEIDTGNLQGLGADRLADVYGALKLHPGNSIVINIGTVACFNVVSEERGFISGAIYPGLEMGARALAQQTDLLPCVDISKPEMCGSTTTKGNIRGGLYYGFLGAVERILHLLKEENFSSSASSQVILTGNDIADIDDEPDHHTSAETLKQDLAPLVDVIEPDLTLIGLHEMYQQLHINK